LEVFHDKSEEGFGFKYFENGKFVKLWIDGSGYK
jgi:hypothetical protein